MSWVPEIRGPHGLYIPDDGDRRLVVSGTQPPRDYAVLDTLGIAL